MWMKRLPRLSLGSEEHRAIARDAAARSLTLIKYENAAALADQNIVVAGALAHDVRCAEQRLDRQGSHRNRGNDPS